MPAFPSLFGLADAVVNATRGNAADKVVYEAAAACLPVFAASPVFDTFLAEGFASTATIRAHLPHGFAATPARRARAAGSVEAAHSVDHWAERVLEEAAAEAARPLRLA